MSPRRLDHDPEAAECCRYLGHTLGLHRYQYHYLFPWIALMLFEQSRPSRFCSMAANSPGAREPLFYPIDR